MNKWKLVIASMLSLTLLSGCQLMSGKTGDLDAVISQVVEGDRIDAPVEIADDVVFKTMDEKEKAEMFAELDKIEKHGAGTKSPISYSNVKELTSDEDYLNFVLDSNKAAQIIYLGFDECPYCKTFTPKLNQFAKENDLTIYYYNTRKRANDPNYESTVANFKIETVPHAFIMHKGKLVGKINDSSSMAAIEAFVNKVLELNK